MNEKAIVFDRSVSLWKAGWEKRLVKFLVNCIKEINPSLDERALIESSDLLGGILFILIERRFFDPGEIHLIADNLDIRVKVEYDLLDDSPENLSMMTLNGIVSPSRIATIQAVMKPGSEIDTETGNKINLLNRNRVMRFEAKCMPQEDQQKENLPQKEADIPESSLGQLINRQKWVIDSLGLTPPIGKAVEEKLIDSYDLWQRQETLLAPIISVKDLVIVLGNFTPDSPKAQNDLKRVKETITGGGLFKKGTELVDLPYRLGVMLDDLGTQEAGWELERMPQRVITIGEIKPDNHRRKSRLCILSMPQPQPDSDKETDRPSDAEADGYDEKGALR